MDFNRLTQKAQEALGTAAESARQRGNPEVYPEHLGLALLAQEFPSALLERAGLDIAALQRELGAKLAERPAVQGGAQQQPRLSTAVADRLDAAEKEMAKLDDEYVSVEHIVLALGLGERDAVLAALGEIRGSQRVTSQNPEGTYD
ncbi:MAG: Clp protease N-terminal domain-containing protein, partial [Gaiellaceae bacterium]